MPRYKITAFYHDLVGNYGWSFSSFRQEASDAACVIALDGFNDQLMSISSTKVFMDGALVADQAGGVPSRFHPSTDFTTPQGTDPADPNPMADGLMFQGYGGAVAKGRSEWLFHGIADGYLASYNQWDVVGAPMPAVLAAAAVYFLQYRPNASPVHAYPIVDPPQPFFTWRWNNFVRLRRVGRPLSRGGQGLRTRS